MHRTLVDIGRRSADRSWCSSLLAGLTICARSPPATALGEDYLPSPLPQLSPPPVVRMVSVTTNRGARVRLLTAKAPVRSTIVSRCRAKVRTRCPYSQKVTRVTGSSGTRALHIKGFERSFRAGVVLELFVVKAARTGKYASFTIRLRNTPQRRDRCVTGLTLKPVSCPTG